MLTDIDQAGADIEHFIRGMDVGAYAGSALTQAAVERKFEVIGEALNRLLQARPDLAERIPRHRRIIDFRNLLIHGYASVLPERVWDYAENHLPQLRRIVQALLAELARRSTVDNGEVADLVSRIFRNRARRGGAPGPHSHPIR